MDTTLKVRIDSDVKNKAVYTIKSKGKNLSEVVREMLQEYADEFDKKNSK